MMMFQERLQKHTGREGAEEEEEEEEEEAEGAEGEAEAEGGGGAGAGRGGAGGAEGEGDGVIDMVELSGSILPFLPPLRRLDNGGLAWPRDLRVALKSLVLGPSKSLIHGSEALCDLIQELRDLSRLPPLPRAPLDGIRLYFDDLIKREDAQNFFENVLPHIGKLALRLPELLASCSSLELVRRVSLSTEVHLRILKPQEAGIVILTQELAASIFACAFFCIYPSNGRDKARLPYFNFDGLFSNIGHRQENKLHCIMNYFSRLCESMPSGVVTYERKVLSPLSEHDRSFWGNSSHPLCPLKVFESGKIEDQCSNALEVDFANQFLGGGVLFQGCVQEEIRFVINPELIVGMLFMSRMDDNEAIEIRGAERFSKYDGYASTFTFEGNYVDKKAMDALGRRETYIIGIDALMQPGCRQFKEANILRETNKAFCGFSDHAEKYLSGFLESRETRSDNDEISVVRELSNTEAGVGESCTIEEHHTTTEDLMVLEIPSAQCATGIATGNWGCGAFGGDVELKSMLQWIAASQAGRPFLHYYTFGDGCGRNLQKIADWVRNEEWAVGDLWNLLTEYAAKRIKRDTEEGLFTWILPSLSQPRSNQAHGN